MATKKRGLGRGLDSLLSGSVISKNIPATNIDKLAVNLLQRGQYQPRMAMEPAALDELAQSINSQGIIQPIIVRKLAGKKYEIIAGERRWQAAKIAKLTEVPVIIREVGDSAAIAMSLIENIQREDLNPIEEANSMQRLIAEFSLTQQKVADIVGKSRPQVANLLRLLGLPELIKKMLAAGELEMGHARALLALDADEQLAAARDVSHNNLTVRATETLVKKLLTPNNSTGTSQPYDSNIKKLEQDLEQILGAKVDIKNSIADKGKLVITYNSLDELDGILAHIK